MLQQGDIVRFLNDVGGGRVMRVSGNIAYVADEDGFETPMPVRECVVVQQAKDAAAIASVDVTAPKPKAAPSHFAATTAKTPAPQPTKFVAAGNTGIAPAPAQPEYDDDEVDGGDVLNLVLGFEPTDIKQLSHSDYDAYLVNDSNYCIYFAMMTAADGSDEWTLQRAGMVEPNIQLLLGTYTGTEVGRFDRIAVQYMAVKRARDFAMKAPASVTHRVDTTKFFKLHCFRDNMYFDGPVLAFDIVTDDKPYAQPVPIVDGETLAREMKRKVCHDRRPVRKHLSKPKAAPGEPLVVDLHIAQLVDNTRGLSNADMLNMQVDEFRRVMDANLRNYGQKIVFIHGKGEGVLRQALMKELNHRYKGHDVQDASFAQYGYGATQVTIRQLR